MAGSKTIFATQLTDTKPTDVEGVGRIRWEDDKCYRWISNPVTNFTPGPNDIVCHSFTDGATALQKISKPATATLGFMGGIAVTTISASTGTNPLTYGWIQVFGPATVTVTPVNTQTTAAPVAGNGLIAVNAVSTYAASGQAMGTAPIYTRRLLLLDSVAGATVAQTNCNVLVQCL